MSGGAFSYTLHNGTMTPAEGLRQRFRELLRDVQMNQSTLCQRLTKRTGRLWRESRLSKILNGHIAWEVDDLVLMCEESGISMVDLVRQPGREFVADCTPTEMQVLAVVRDYPELARHVLALLPAPRERRPQPRRRLLTRKEFMASEE